MAEKYYTCKQCNEEFQSARKKLYCSNQCSQDHRSLKRNPNAIRRGKREGKPQCVCVGCGKEYTNKRGNLKSGEGNKYCSRECAFTNKATAICRANYKERPVYTEVYWPECKQCNKTFLSKRKGKAICSRECEVQRNRDLSRAINANNKIVKEIRCDCCGKPFTKSYGIKSRKYCSELCSARATRSAGRAIRRARIRGNGLTEYVNPFKVFDRDKWECCLCGVKTPRSKRGTYDDNAPELDHIITLAEGGQHTYTNTQCLCRKCNQNKRSRSKGQLLLFG